MPYLVQRLSADDVLVEFDVAQGMVQYQLSASIAKGMEFVFKLPVQLVK